MKRRQKLKEARRKNRKPKRPKGERYDTNSYRRAIEYGLKKAKKAGFAVPHWHPHQLRHNRGTEVRRKYGIEAAQVSLGHKRVDVKDYDKKDSLYVAIQNVFGSQKSGLAALGEMRVDLCNYYRLVRNAAVHSDRAESSLTGAFAKVKDYRDKATQQYDKIAAAPSPPDNLTRDDFQLFIRVAQDVAWGFSEELKPTDEQLRVAVEKVAESFNKHWVRNTARVHTAIVNYLYKTYGIPENESRRIASQVH